MTWLILVLDRVEWVNSLCFNLKLLILNDFIIATTEYKVKYNKKEIIHKIELENNYSDPSQYQMKY